MKWKIESNLCFNGFFKGKIIYSTSKKNKVKETISSTVQGEFIAFISQRTYGRLRRLRKSTPLTLRRKKKRDSRNREGLLLYIIKSFDSVLEFRVHQCRRKSQARRASEKCSSTFYRHGRKGAGWGAGGRGCDPLEIPQIVRNTLDPSTHKHFAASFKKIKPHLFRLE